MTNIAGDSPEQTRTDLRRRVLTGGVAAAAVTLIGGRASASAPSVLSETELGLLRYAQKVELAIRDLYDVSISAGAANPLWEMLSEQHEAYAQAIAGLSGLSADERDDDLFEQLAPAFGNSATALQAGYDIESTASATHLELVGLVVDSDAAALLASIVTAESRHCVMIADLLGSGNDLGATLVNNATPILP